MAEPCPAHVQCPGSVPYFEVPVQYLVILLILAAILILFSGRSGSDETPGRRAPREREEVDWEYGDVWKEGSPDGPVNDGGVRYVELLRTDTGQGYDDSAMLDLVGYLGSRGVRATFDSFTLGMEPAAIKTYVLKVEAGREAEALQHLKEKAGSSSS